MDSVLYQRIHAMHQLHLQVALPNIYNRETLATNLLLHPMHYNPIAQCSAQSGAQNSRNSLLELTTHLMSLFEVSYSNQMDYIHYHMPANTAYTITTRTDFLYSMHHLYVALYTRIVSRLYPMPKLSPIQASLLA